jgi:hypothetical protein
MLSLAAASAGIISGAIIVFLAHIAPSFGAGNFIRDIDQPKFFRKNITRRESHLLGIFFHLLTSGVFGGLYGVLIHYGIFQSFFLVPILIWSAVLCVFMGGVVLPLEGHGVFGVKEDPWFPIDLLCSNILWGIVFWMVMKLWIAV